MPEPDLYEYAIGENLRKLAAERGQLLGDVRRRLVVVQNQRRLWLRLSLAMNAVLLVALVAVIAHG